MQESKIRHPNKWLCIYPGDYLDEMMGDPAEFGRIMENLFRSSMTGTEPKYEVNKLAIARSHKMWEDWLSKQQWQRQIGKDKFKAVKAELKELKSGKPEEPSLFNKPSVPDNWRELPKHELQKIMTSAEGITEYDFTRWYEDSEKNEWKDSKYGQPIRNPIAACRSYIKGFEQQQKEKKE